MPKIMLNWKAKAGTRPSKFGDNKLKNVTTKIEIEVCMLSLPLKKVYPMDRINNQPRIIFKASIWSCTAALKLEHIFPKAQMAANKNAHNFWHHFRKQFFMLFHMVWSILFKVLALKTLNWKFLIGCWKISTNEKAVYQAKMDHTKWKSIKNCVQKMVPELVCIFVWSPIGFCKDVPSLICPTSKSMIFLQKLNRKN